MNHDADALILALDEWEAAANALALAKLELACGLPVQPQRVLAAEARVVEKEVAWNRLALQVQPLREP